MKPTQAQIDAAAKALEYYVGYNSGELARAALAAAAEMGEPQPGDTLRAEIARLRSELQEFTELKEYAKSLGQETYLELHAKNERLRAALEWITEHHDVQAMLTKAREALRVYEQLTPEQKALNEWNSDTDMNY